MKKTALLLIAALVLVAIPAFSQSFADVRTDHWAYEAIQTLAKDGIIIGYPDGTFGGQRAMTRYEFADALARAINVLSGRTGTGVGVPGPKGETGPAGPMGPKGEPGTPGVSPADLEALRALVNEFRDELAAQGVDIENLTRDMAALAARVTAIEAEMARIKLFGEADMIGRAERVQQQFPIFGGLSPVTDRDGRVLGAGVSGTANNLLQNTYGYEDLAFGLKAKVGDTATLNTLIDAGDYTSFALSKGGLPRPGTEEFVLWNLYGDGALNLGPLGNVDISAGRMPFQLTPYTFKFVDPDSYTNIPRFDNGDFVWEGAKAAMNWGNVGLTAFAGKPHLQMIGGGDFYLMRPSLMVNSVAFPDGIDIAQMAGARLVFGTPFDANIGLSYYRAGMVRGPGGLSQGQVSIYGADVNASIGGFGVAGEWAKVDPNSDFKAVVPGSGDKNTAWNAKLNYQLGNLGLAGGYSQVETNYSAPGYWNRLCSIVNPTNVQGWVADASYAFTPGLMFTAEGQFLTPKDKDQAIAFRTATAKGAMIAPVGLSATNVIDQLNYWKAGLKYALTSADSVDLGWEEVQVKPAGAAFATGTPLDTQIERFITIGFGHSFTSSASVKVLYQIKQSKSESFTSGQDTEGGIATAQLQLKY